MFLQRRRCVPKWTPNFNGKNLRIRVQIFLNVIWLFGGFMLPRFSKCWVFLIFAYAGYCSGQLFTPPPPPPTHFALFISVFLGCVPSFVWLPHPTFGCVWRQLGVVTVPGNNLFGKYGPNAWVSVWVLFCFEVGSTCWSEFWSDSWSEFGMQYRSSWGGFWSEFGLS